MHRALRALPWVLTLAVMFAIGTLALQPTGVGPDTVTASATHPTKTPCQEPDGNCDHPHATATRNPHGHPCGDVHLCTPVPHASHTPVPPSATSVPPTDTPPPQATATTPPQPTATVGKAPTEVASSTPSVPTATAPPVSTPTATHDPGTPMPTSTSTPKPAVPTAITTQGVPPTIPPVQHAPSQAAPSAPALAATPAQEGKAALAAVVQAPTMVATATATIATPRLASLPRTGDMPDGAWGVILIVAAGLTIFGLRLARS